MTTIAENITDEEIEELRHEAAQRSDMALYHLCQVALRRPAEVSAQGVEDARAACAVAAQRVRAADRALWGCAGCPGHGGGLCATCLEALCAG